jgi:hypothetical protein
MHSGPKPIEKIEYERTTTDNMTFSSQGTGESGIGNSHIRCCNVEAADIAVCKTQDCSKRQKKFDFRRKSYCRTKAVAKVRCERLVVSFDKIIMVVIEQLSPWSIPYAHQNKATRLANSFSTFMRRFWSPVFCPVGIIRLLHRLPHTRLRNALDQRLQQLSVIHDNLLQSKILLTTPLEAESREIESSTAAQEQVEAMEFEAWGLNEEIGFFAFSFGKEGETSAAANIPSLVINGRAAELLRLPAMERARLLQSGTAPASCSTETNATPAPHYCRALPDAKIWSSCSADVDVLRHLVHELLLMSTTEDDLRCCTHATRACSQMRVRETT